MVVSMIECKSLAWRAGAFALGPLEYGFRPGCTVILGPNGSGKSSLLALIAGLVRPDSGSVFCDSQDICRLSNKARAGLIAFAPQLLQAPPGLCLADFVSMGRYRFTGGSGRAIYGDLASRTAVRDMLALVGLGGCADADLSVLSGGEQRLAILARALVQEADWTLLDEPAGFLDYAHNAVLHGLLAREKRAGHNLILVTHDADFAASIADSVICLRQGRIIHQGSALDAANPEILKEVFGTDFLRTTAGRILQDYGHPS